MAEESGMKSIKTGLLIEDEELRLCPVVSDGEILLYDIYLGKDWHGSRRTVSACGMFMGVPDLMERLWG